MLAQTINPKGVDQTMNFHGVMASSAIIKMSDVLMTKQIHSCNLKINHGMLESTYSK